MATSCGPALHAIDLVGGGGGETERTRFVAHPGRAGALGVTTVQQ